MPLCLSETSGQKTMNLKNEDAFVKERYMLSRDRITLFTQVSSDDSIELPFEFVFKGKGTKTKLTPPPGKNVYYQWSEKGSYWEQQMLETISHLPNRATPFTSQTGQGYALYVLDNFSFHLCHQ